MGEITKQIEKLVKTLEEGVQKLNRQIDSKKMSSKDKKGREDKLAYDSDESAYRETKRIKEKKKVGKVTDADRMNAAMQDEIDFRKRTGKKPLPKAISKKVTEGAKEDYKKADSDERAYQARKDAHPGSAMGVDDDHEVARNEKNSSRQGKKVKGLKPRQRDVDSHRKYLKSRLKLRRRND